MFTNSIENTQMWANDLTYDQYEVLRLERIKEQRQRMENMKDLVQKYIKIISDLEYKNMMLLTENEQLKATRFGTHESSQSEYYLLHQKYLETCEQLSRETKRRQQCEQAIQALRNQLTSTGIGSHQVWQPYKRNFQLELNNKIETDYQILVGLYSDLQDQIYALEKENISLKEVVREQSKLCYEKENFWKQNDRRQASSLNNRSKGTITNKQNRPGVIKISSKQNIKQSTNQITQIKTVQIQQKNTSNTEKPSDLFNTEQYATRLSKKQLQVQVKKQGELIKKFKQSEEQQLKLIDILKSQKTKVCKCHASSKNIIGSGKAVNALVSFNGKSDFVQQVQMCAK